MKQKKAFVLYHDYWEFLKLLTDEEIGCLLRVIYMYEREQKLPEGLKPTIEMAFTMIKETLDRDRRKYEQVCNRNREVARVRWQKMKDCGIEPSAYEMDKYPE